MDEAKPSYHPQLSEQSRMQIVRTIIAIALWEARKEIKRKIQSEGRKLSRVPVREIERLAKAMVMERRDEFIAKAKASSVVQDEKLTTFEQSASGCDARTSNARMSRTEWSGEMIVG